VPTEAPSEPPTEAPPPAATPEPATPATPLAILSPQDGATLDTDAIIVVGGGPANARIVRDISFGFDDETVSDANGTWAMEVDLDEGPNVLVFRVGDDTATEVTLEVTYAPAPEVEPTPDPEPTPGPVSRFATIDDGTWEVGRDIKPGTYRTREPAFFCYWARLKSFSGSLSSIIANDNLTGYGVVTIRSTDRGFETNGCPTWTKDLSQVTESRTRFGEGTFIVGTDLRPGTYRNTGGEFCYWARLRDFRGQLSSIISNDLASRRTIVTIRSTDQGFESSGCGTWVRR
jgi:hypothetical protein